MICLSDFVVKSAVTKYAIKNYISKSIVVSGLICKTGKNRVYFDIILCFSAHKGDRDVILVPNCYTPYVRCIKIRKLSRINHIHQELDITIPILSIEMTFLMQFDLILAKKQYFVNSDSHFYKFHG